MNTKVIYTAIFGDYDVLQNPAVSVPGTDFVCFTDQDFASNVWQIRKVATPLPEDATRSARMYKLLPHRYLGGYEYSVWIDGNIRVRGDTNELLAKHLAEVNCAVYDHAYARHRDKTKSPDCRRSPYEEAEKLYELAARGRVKDDPSVIETQMARYREEGFPDTTGVLQSMVLLRRHTESDVKAAMEAWWEQIKTFSKRDQLSFNYAAWKTGLAFGYIKENVRENDYFIRLDHKK